MPLSERTRARIHRLLQNHNSSFRIQPDPGDSWTVDTDCVSEVASSLLDVYGLETLPGNESGPDHGCSHFQTFLRWADGEYVLDTLELFLGCVHEEPAFVSALNELLIEEDSSWRMLGQEMVVLDGVFVHEQVVARAYEMSKANGFEGAAHEMQLAQNDLIDHDDRGAIHNAGSSFESVVKALVGKESGNIRMLLLDLKEQGYFADVPDEHVDGFVENVLQALPWLRNRFGGHGQGRFKRALPPPYARLAVSLAASLNQFLIELELERTGRQPEGPPPADFVFTPFGADEDIPF